MIEKKLKELEEVLLKKFTSMTISVNGDPFPNSPDYVLTSIRRLKTVEFGPEEYILFGRLIEWCYGQGIINGEEARLFGTF